MPPPGLQIYLRLVWPWSLTSCDLDLDLDLKVDRFTPLARETLVPIGFKIGSKYCVNKFGNRRVDGQTNGQMEEQTDNPRRLCHRLPIRPWAGIRSRTHSVISLFVSVFCWVWRSADSPLNIADLCPAIPDMGLLYLLSYLLWLFILLRGQGRLWCSRISAKVRLGVYLAVWF